MALAVCTRCKSVLFPVFPLDISPGLVIFMHPLPFSDALSNSCPIVAAERSRVRDAT